MVFLELSCFFDYPTDVGNLISGFSAFSKSSLNIWEFMVLVLLKPGLQNFEHYFASVWDKCNCAVVWVFFGIAFLWDWNENWPFPVLWPLLSFPNLLAYWVQHFHSSNSVVRDWRNHPGKQREQQGDHYSQPGHSPSSSVPGNLVFLLNSSWITWLPLGREISTLNIYFILVIKTLKCYPIIFFWKHKTCFSQFR